MKIVLTNEQARLTIEALQWAQNDDFPDSDPFNRKYQRIINKLEQALLYQRAGENQRKESK